MRSLRIPNIINHLEEFLPGNARVHILKSFVLIYEIVPSRKAVCFTRFAHHDKAY